jgi:hypothetical protein
MHTQPNHFDKFFDVIDDFAGLPGTPIVGPGTHVDCGFRNYPSVHELHFVWGGDVAPTGVNARLQGTLYHDPPNAPADTWFDLTPNFDFTPTGLTAKINSEVSPARGIRYIINTITGGTNPTLQPVYAGQVG